MKKNKKITIGFIIAGSIIFITAAIFLIMNFSYDEYSFTLVEKRWIENNKNKLIDIEVLNDTPILGEYGQGVFFEFLDYIVEDSGLQFNLIPVKISDEISSDTLSLFVDNNSDSDYILYIDRYVLVSKNKNQYDHIDEISGLTIGVLSSDKSSINYYIGNNDIEYETYSSNEELLEAYNLGEIDNVILSLVNNYEFVLDSDNFINFNMYDISTNYVFNINTSNESLNDIMIKYYYKFMDNYFLSIYNEYYNDLYYQVNNINSSDLSKLTSKIYSVGIIIQEPYISFNNDNYSGLIVNYLSDYSDITKAEFEYIIYNSYEELLESKSQLDIIFNYFNNDDFGNDFYSILSNHKEEYVILAKSNVDFYATTIKSLKSLDVFVLNNSILKEYVQLAVGTNIIGYNNIEELKKNITDDDIIVIDKQVYNYYSSSIFEDYIIKYQSEIDLDYNFIVNDNSENKLFINSFEKYISLTNYDKIIYEKYDFGTDFNIITLVQLILVGILGIITIIFVIQFYIKKNKERIVKKKDDKLKYIDILTSLKNRNYLNNNIDIWDKNNVYPQAVVMLDLNKIKYVNDNFGISEGDNIIKKCANILIKNQLQNTDIIRTDGNEFMIYMVGYAEAQVIAYCRKLYKEMKDLPHAYGASVGHSMILDNIKTIDDATNEAMIIVRDNKEIR